MCNFVGLFLYFGGVKVAKNGIARSYDSHVFNFKINCQIRFPKRVVPFYIPQNIQKISMKVDS